MDDNAKIKIVAICGLVALEIANLLTAKIDGNIILTIGAIIGGIAGYTFKTVTAKSEEKEG
jgi:predicted membrane-bound spermidine synthase